MRRGEYRPSCYLAHLLESIAHSFGAVLVERCLPELADDGFTVRCGVLEAADGSNIDPATICVGDHWTAAESLATLIRRIVEMLCFQSYNVKSPRNGEAAREFVCQAGHLLCPDCTLRCEPCGKLLCLACGVVACDVCRP